jgi:preprotein translocase subunit SecG
MPTRRLTWLLTALMFAQALLGLLLPDQYRDAEWIRATWYGNDWVTMVGAVPLLWVGRRSAGRGSVRGLLLMLGLAGYAVYNYAFYLFGAALNAFLPLYVVIFVVAIVTLVLVLSRLESTAVASCFNPAMPARTVGGYLVFVAIGLAIVWLGMWGAYAFAGRPTPIEPEAFKIVAALDLSLMVPALALGGVLLWRRQPWGYVIATIAAIQGALYLIVLCVNSAIAINRGLAAAPGELPFWGPLAFFTTIAAIVLLRSVSGHLPAPVLADISHRK